LAVAERVLRSFERDKGEYSGKPGIPALDPAENALVLREREPLMHLLDLYGEELARTGRGAEALRRWRPCFASLSAFVKHGAAQLLTRADILRWRDELLKTLSPKTVRDSHLAALKAVLAWAVDAGKLTSSVGADVRVRVPRATQSREKGFTDDEARALLQRARHYAPEAHKNRQTTENVQLTALGWGNMRRAPTSPRAARLRLPLTAPPARPTRKRRLTRDRDRDPCAPRSDLEVNAAEARTRAPGA
jgi:hypothetical protein